MIRRVKAAVVAILALAFASFAGASTTSGRIVFSATDAPLLNDVMVVHTDGTKIDLSKSTAYDAWPELSPNGKLVAFFSTRGGHGAEYVVKIDGSGLHKVSPSVGTATIEAAWSRDSRDLALQVGARIYRTSAAGGSWARIDRGNVQNLIGWSPANTVAYLTPLDDVVVVSSAGKQLHTFNGLTALWSPTGQLAVQRGSETWQVYAANGTRLSTIAARAVAWSPAGRLASIAPGGMVQVRAGGAGRPVVTARPVRQPGALLWANETHLLVQGEDGYVGYDLVHHATFELAQAYRIDPSLARDGTAFGAADGLTLVRSTLSGSTHTVAAVDACGGKDSDPYESLQALPDGSGAIYAGDCVAPHDLYSVAPDGSDLVQLTNTPQDELEPTVSPDGTRVAFARAPAGGCVGCDVQIWTSALDGSDAHAVTLTAGTQDENPSFSPDGRSVAFSRWEPTVTGDSARLAEAPATGGIATLLKVSGGFPAWGAAGIAFDSSGKIVVAKPDGSDPQTVAKGDWIPAWSNDGRLALMHWGNPMSIFFPATKATIGLPGLHEPVGPVPGLAWSPDGTQLALTAADGNGEDDVWKVNADGTGLTRVTNGLVADGALAWR